PGVYIPPRAEGRPAGPGKDTAHALTAGPRRAGRPPDAMSSPAGHLLLFGLLPERPAAELPPSAATDETEGWHLLRRPTELAFPLHTLAARAWFEGRYV
ncbi:hypothetical protein ACFXJP_26035, partial [Streptomyces mirabilis]